MKKLFLFLLLSLGLTFISYGSYLDDRTDDQFCRWMDNLSHPDHIIAEVAAARETERGNRADDQRSEAAMEERKKEGYF